MNDQGLYILSAGGYWKVGRAYDVSSRIRQLQCGCPEPIACFEFFTAEFLDLNDISVVELERELHGRLRGYRTSGEWFHAPERAIVSAFREMFAKCSKPAVYARWQRLRAWRRAEGKA